MSLFSRFKQVAQEWNRLDKEIISLPHIININIVGEINICGSNRNESITITEESALSLCKSLDKIFDFGLFINKTDTQTQRGWDK
jgi:hypothetical protein